MKISAELAEVLKNTETNHSYSIRFLLELENRYLKMKTFENVLKMKT